VIALFLLAAITPVERPTPEHLMEVWTIMCLNRSAQMEAAFEQGVYWWCDWPINNAETIRGLKVQAFICESSDGVEGYPAIRDDDPALAFFHKDGVSIEDAKVALAIERTNGCERPEVHYCVEEGWPNGVCAD
jgi:hypothetical protein